METPVGILKLFECSNNVLDETSRDVNKKNDVCFQRLFNLGSYASTFKHVYIWRMIKGTLSRQWVLHTSPGAGSLEWNVLEKVNRICKLYHEQSHQVLPEHYLCAYECALCEWGSSIVPPRH